MYNIYLCYISIYNIYLLYVYCKLSQLRSFQSDHVSSFSLVSISYLQLFIDICNWFLYSTFKLPYPHFAHKLFYVYPEFTEKKTLKP